MYIHIGCTLSPKKEVGVGEEESSGIRGGESPIDLTVDMDNYHECKRLIASAPFIASISK